MTLGEAKIQLASSGMEDAEDICECLKVLYSARAGEQGLDRDFGISLDAVDKPTSVAKALLAAEIVRKTKKYEPRVEVVRIDPKGGVEKCLKFHSFKICRISALPTTCL